MQPRKFNAVMCNVVNEIKIMQCDNALDYNNPVQCIHFSVMMICSVMIQCNVVSALDTIMQCSVHLLPCKCAVCIITVIMKCAPVALST